MKRSDFVKVGRRLGLDPRQIDELTLWEIAWLVVDHNEEHGKAAPMSDEEFEAGAERAMMIANPHWKVKANG